MSTLRYFVCLCTVSSYEHTTIVAYVCVWYVVTLHVKGNADIQHSSMFKTKPVLLLKANTSCRQPSLWLSLVPPLESFIVQTSFSYLYLISYKSTLIWFYIDVCSLKSNCHACIFCVLYGVFELFINKNHILSERYVCMRCKRELWAHAGMFFFFPVCGRTCVCMPNKKLHIFKAF